MNKFIFQNTSGKYHKFPQVYADLNLNRVADRMDRTITIFGKEKLNHRIRYVMSDPTDLQNAIDLNQMVAVDDRYRSNMTKSLLKIKKIEKNVTRWMKSNPDEVNSDDEGKDNSKDKNEKNGMNKNTDTDLYFQKGHMYNPFNIMNNRYALTVSNRFVMSSILIIIMVYVFIYLYMYYYGFPLSMTDYVYGIYQGYVMFCRFLLMQIMTNLDWIETGAIILAITYVGYQIYTSYKSVMICYEHYCLCSDFVGRYETMCDFIAEVENIYEADRYIRNTVEEKDILESINYLKSYFTKGSSLGYSLVSQISTYDYVSHMNRVANYIGKLDMVLSITRLMDEGYTLPIIRLKTTSANTYGYDFPSFTARGIWNPMIGYEKSVRNSLTVDPTMPNVVILTGPNKAGKSTFMKSLLLTIYMAQSLGICSADSLLFTPFRDLFTYLNIPDAIGRESLFEAEVNRCYDYLKRCEELRGFSFGIIDELFTGTNPPEGMAGSYAILNQVIMNPVNITVISTHFHDMLKELNKSYFTFKMFRCDTMVNVFGKKTHRFDYRLFDGISDQMIALSLLEEKGFDSQTVANAHRFINKLRATKRIENKTNKDNSVKSKSPNDDRHRKKAERLLDELGNDDPDNSDKNDKNSKDLIDKNLQDQYTRALEYSKKYNVAQGLPPIIRR